LLLPLVLPVLFGTVLFLVLCGAPAFSQTLNSYVTHSDEDAAYIYVQNTRAEDSFLWLQFRTGLGEDWQSERIELPARTRTKYAFEALGQYPWMQILVPDSAGLHIEGLIRRGSLSTPFNPVSPAGNQFHFSQVRAGAEISISNLSGLTNHISIEAPGTTLTTQLQLEPYARVSVPVRNLANGTYFSRQAAFTIALKTELAATASLTDTSQTDFFQMARVEPGALAPPPSGAYFLVEARDGLQSTYILHLTETNEIAAARAQLVRDPTHRQLVVAALKSGAGDFNRDLRERGRTWSWHPESPIEFADLGSISCGGNPQVIEEQIPEIFAAQSTICFWNHIVTRELTADEVATGQLDP
jgi:hypothetical protein